MRAALLVIDIQRFFFKRAEQQAALKALVARVNELIDAFHTRALPVIHICTVHRADGSTGDLWMKENHVLSLVEGTPDAEEFPEVHRKPSDYCVTKTRHSAFLRTPLEGLLQEIGVDTVILTGFSTNGCIGLTAMDAYEHDFHVILSGEATASHDARRGAQMLQVLQDEFGIEPLSNDDILNRIPTPDIG